MMSSKRLLLPVAHSTPSIHRKIVFIWREDGGPIPRPGKEESVIIPLHNLEIKHQKRVQMDYWMRAASGKSMVGTRRFTRARGSTWLTRIISGIFIHHDHRARIKQKSGTRRYASKRRVILLTWFIPEMGMGSHRALRLKDA